MTARELEEQKQQLIKHVAVVTLMDDGLEFGVL